MTSGDPSTPPLGPGSGQALAQPDDLADVEIGGCGPDLDLLADGVAAVANGRARPRQACRLLNSGAIPPAGPESCRRFCKAPGWMASSLTRGFPSSTSAKAA